jgi:sensor histidine kinase regulating citrate/malate metabolism
VSELLANGYDADASEVRVSIPDTNDENAVIEITDTGNGMDGEELKNKFLFLGRNRRSDGEKTKLGRPGFGISSKIHLVTWKSGQQSSMTLDRDAFSDLESLSTNAIPIFTARKSG